MKYLMLIKHVELRDGDAIPQALMDAMGPYMEEAFASGALKETAGLKGTAEGTRIRSSGGKVSVIDGPFAETKEMVGGFAIFEVASREEALDHARRFVDLHVTHWPEFEFECEIRAIAEM